MSGSSGSVRAITCPSCGGTIEVRAAGYTVTLACQHCGSLLDTTHADVQIITAYKRAAKNFAIALGTRGTLFGTEWQVIGALKRHSSDSGDWQEFLLFNPYAGYRWLVVAEGEWQFGTMLMDRPEGSGRTVSWRGQTYTLAGTESAETRTVLGEFYWKVARGDTASASTFEGRSGVLSHEEVAGEVTWTQLAPVDADEVASAFSVSRKFVPKPDTPSFGQRFMGAPRSGSDDLPMMFLMALAALLAIGLVQELLSYPHACAKSEAAVTVGSGPSSTKIGTIEAWRPWQFVTIDAVSSEFQNRWVDLDYSLVNRKTQQSIDAYGVVEYYTGTDSDGPWAEGSRGANTLFSSVPGGTYDIFVETGAHGWPNDPTPPANGGVDGTGTWAPPNAADLAYSGGDAWASAEKITIWFEACTGGFSWGVFWIMAILLFALPLTMLWWRLRD